MNGQLRNTLYALSLTPAVCVILGNVNGGWFVWLNTVYILIILALLEWVIPSIKSQNHTPKTDSYPNLILLMHVCSQLLCIVSFFYGFTEGKLTGVDALGAAISMGINSGSSAIVAAHEFIHRKSKINQWLGKLLLFTAGNFYFFIEHLRVHHKWVGTEKDAASAKRGQHLYAFFIKSGAGQLTGAIKLENERLVSMGKSIYTLEHYVFRQFVQHLILDVIIVVTIGWLALFWYVIHCIVANFLLEYVNYIEHYGLERDLHTKVTEVHSWQSDSPISRFLLIDLSRHADHHYYASKPYHTLLSHEKSPELPAGYAGMFLIAAIPPLWFKVMDKRIPS